MVIVIICLEILSWSRISSFTFFASIVLLRTSFACWVFKRLNLVHNTYQTAIMLQKWNFSYYACNAWHPCYLMLYKLVINFEVLKSDIAMVAVVTFTDTDHHQWLLNMFPVLVEIVLCFNYHKNIYWNILCI